MGGSFRFQDTTMAITGALTLIELPWLRQSAHKAGALAVPSKIASRLLAGGLVELDSKRACLTITKRGQLALARLG
jgi:hypothetical protein